MSTGDSRTSLYIALTLNACLSSIFFGYEISIINPFLPSIDDFIHTSSEAWIIIIVDIVPGGAVVGTLCSDLIVRNVGRRGGLLLNNLI